MPNLTAILAFAHAELDFKTPMDLAVVIFPDMVQKFKLITLSSSKLSHFFKTCTRFSTKV